MDACVLVSLYLAGVRERPASPNTICAYRSALERFVSFLPSSLAGAPTDGDLHSAWLAWRAAEPLGASTERLYRSIVCTWADWCVAGGHLSGHSLRSISCPPAPKPMRRRLARSAFELLLRVCLDQEDEWLRHRSAALLYVAFTALLRRAEILALRVEDLRLSDDPPKLFVAAGKGCKSRWVSLCDECVFALRQWLALRGDGVDRWLWIARGRSGMRRYLKGDLYSDLARWAAVVGLDRLDALPHAFRRGGGRAMLKAGVDLAIVSRVYGHADLATTAIYVEADDVAAEEARNWFGSGGRDSDRLALERMEAKLEALVEELRARGDLGTNGGSL